MCGLYLPHFACGIVRLMPTSTKPETYRPRFRRCYVGDHAVHASKMLTRRCCKRCAPARANTGHRHHPTAPPPEPTANASVWSDEAISEVLARNRADVLDQLGQL